MNNDLHEKFADYIESYKALIIKVASMYCHDAESRKDLVQDIVVQLWRSYSKYDDTYALSTWTYRIALNVSISYLRKEKSRLNTLSQAEHQLNVMSWDDDVIDSRLSALKKAIDQLRPLDKAVIILQLEGCPNSEISEIMGISISNVSTKLHRIKEQLKKSIKHKID